MTQHGMSARSAERKASPLFELAIVRPFTPHAMDDRLQQNKQTVMAFYDLMFNACRPVNLYGEEDAFELAVYCRRKGLRDLGLPRAYYERVSDNKCG